MLSHGPPSAKVKGGPCEKACPGSGRRLERCGRAEFSSAVAKDGTFLV